MKDDTVSRAAVMQSLTKEYNRRRTGDGLKLAWIEKAVNDVSAIQTCEDAVSRQQAIDAIGKKSDEIYKTKQKGATYPHDDFFQGMAYAENVVKQLPSVQPQPEEDCDTCKYGFFGSRQCDNCRVRYPSHYEREEEQHFKTMIPLEVEKAKGRKTCGLECLRCKQTYGYSWDTMDEISYTMYAYCPDCIRKGIQLLKSQDKEGAQE